MAVLQIFYDKDFPFRSQPHGPHSEKASKGQQAYSHNPHSLLDPVRAFYVKGKNGFDCAAMVEILMQPSLVHPSSDALFYS